MEFANTIEIDRPAHDVFRFLADFQNVPRWNYATVETRKTSPGPVGVGATYRQLRSVPTRSEEFEIRNSGRTHGWRSAETWGRSREP